MVQPKDFGYGVEEQLLRTEVRNFLKKNCDELTLMGLVRRIPTRTGSPNACGITAV